jgi:hypothetical protein
MTLWIVGVIIILFPSFAFPPAVSTVLHIVLGSLVVVVGIIIHSERALRGYFSLNNVAKKTDPKTKEDSSKKPQKLTPTKQHKEQNKKATLSGALAQSTTQDVAMGIRSLISNNTKISQKVSKVEAQKEIKKEEVLQKKEIMLDTVPHPGLAKLKKTTFKKEEPNDQKETKKEDVSKVQSVPHAATLRNRSWVVGDKE